METCERVLEDHVRCACPENKRIAILCRTLVGATEKQQLNVGEKLQVDADTDLGSNWTFYVVLTLETTVRQTGGKMSPGAI